MIKIDKKRHLLKTITWRIIATTFTFLVVWLITGEIELGIGLAVIEFIGKMFLYYYHERCWYRFTDFGVKRKIDNKVYWFTGLSGSGKSTIAEEFAKHLDNSFILDGDIFRNGLSKDLGFSIDDRDENIRRSAEVAKVISELGYNVIVAFISPYMEQRKNAKNIIGDKFIEVYIDTPLIECVRRDPKGLYKLVKEGKIKNFTGIDDPYEEPKNPDIIIKTENKTPKECVCNILKNNNKL